MIYSVPPTYLIDAALNKSGCYYVWIEASPKSQSKTGDYGLVFSLK
jgi:hypothetical protein